MPYFSQEKEDLFSMIEQDQKPIELLPEIMTRLRDNGINEPTGKVGW